MRLFLCNLMIRAMWLQVALLNRLVSKKVVHTVYQLTERNHYVGECHSGCPYYPPFTDAAHGTARDQSNDPNA